MAAEEQKPAQDASIEDVLSSIKQIVEQESGTKTPGVAQATAQPAVVATPSAPVQPAADVLELSETEIMAAGVSADLPAPGDSGLSEADLPVAEPEVVDIDAFTKTGAAAATPAPVTASPAKATVASPARPLPEGHVHLTAMAGAKGLQVGFPVEVLAEALRPLIKDWVDSNLPDIVERLVKEELAKLADK